MENGTLTFASWLTEELERRGWKNADLMRAADVSSGTVSMWRTGKRNPDPESCKRIAAAMRIDPDLVLHYAGHRDMSISERRARERAQVLRSLDTALSSTIRFIKDEELKGGVYPIPFWGVVPADCSRGTNFGEEQETVAVPEFYLRGRSPDRVFIVQTSGDCMAGRGIYHGYHVYCEQLADGQHPQNGDIVVIQFGGECSLKAWHRVGDWIELRDGNNDVVQRFSILDEWEVKGIAFTHVGFH